MSLSYVLTITLLTAGIVILAVQLGDLMTAINHCGTLHTLQAVTACLHKAGT